MPNTLMLHPIFSDHAVLPRDVPLPVYGRAVPGQTVKVGFGGQQSTAKADREGWWEVLLEPMPAGGPHVLTVSLTGEQLIRRDLMIGDVWLASGQSSMEWPLADTANATEEIAAADNPKLRLFSAPRYAVAQPMRENDGKWAVCSPETVATFSAIGYHFGRLMHDALNVPIGIIDASWGESKILSWTPADFIRGRDELKEAGRVLLEDPQAKSVPLEDFPSALYNGMIAPFTRFPIRGVLWYQGESDVPRTGLYRFAFRNLIQAWRQTWGRFDLPFLFAQIAGHGGEREIPGDDPWAEMREIQAEVLQLPATGMAVAADTGDSRGINPRDERTVAERLALVALAVAYRFDVVCSGPVYEGFKIEDDSIRLLFSHAESGLLVRRADKLKGFAIAGNDRVFRWADACIDGPTVVVNHPAVRAPVAVRYAWESSPLLCLFNGSGLPAAPFRTDDWEALTYRDVPGKPARRKLHV